MTSLQIKHGFGKTTSGKLNKKHQEGKFKQIQLGDYDVQMLSPQFLSTKTLKKPLRDYTVLLSKMNLNYIKAENDTTQKNAIPENINFELLNSMQGSKGCLNKTQKIQYTFIGLDSSKDIKPAYNPLQADNSLKINPQQQSMNFFLLDDKNTVFSAIAKKGQQVRNSVTFDLSKKPIEQKTTQQIERKVDKAENKLKQLFNKNNKSISFEQPQIRKEEKKQVRMTSQIDQEINQSINQYGDEGFEQYSSQSGIKESIREEFGASSGSKFIKQSIREQFGLSSNGKNVKSEIGEQIHESIKGSISASKEQIPEFIASYNKSSRSNIREEIAEELSGSKKSVQQVYEQIFEQYDDSMKNSRTAFKKSTQFKEKDDLLSKSFRKKTSIAKSIKLAEEINQQHKLEEELSSKRSATQTSKYGQQLQQEKKHLQKKKFDLNELLSKKSQTYQIPSKNKNLTYEFRIELNKLLTSENFESKLKRLTSFINFGQNEIKTTVNSLQDRILNNILNSINQIKKSEIGNVEIQRLKKEYDDKLRIMMKDQEVSLRVQMDKKLHEKDMEVKKMIAELQKKFQGKAFSLTAGFKGQGFGASQQNLSTSGLYDMESDYSIDSDNISWKADLWEVLPEYQKKKLYEKQAKQVTNFLTDIMMNELKEESLSRGDFDISFEFPDEFNDSITKSGGSSLPKLNSVNRNASTEDFMPKAAFNRKEFQENIPINHPPKKESIFPDFPRPKQPIYQHQPDPIEMSRKQSINQYSKIQGQTAPESTKKLKIEREKIIQVLSKYKSAYSRKKNDVIRKILKTLKPKDAKKIPGQILSVIQEISILGKEDINQNDLIYVRAYEQELVWALTNIIMKNENKKTPVIEEEMRRNYDRLVVICQAKVAENAEEVVCLDIYEEKKDLNKVKNNVKSMECKPCPMEIVMREQAVGLLQKKGEKDLKNELVDNIISALMSQFAKQFPKKRK